MQLLIVLFFVLIGSDASEKDALKYKLLRNYDKTKKPVDNDHDIVLVNVTLVIKNIIEFDILNGVATSDLIFGLQWNDMNLQWDESVNNISYISFALKYIWHPTINMCNGVMDRFKIDEDTEIFLQPSGNVFLFINRNFQTYCRINVNKYPFDEHECDILVCFNHQIFMVAAISEFNHFAQLESTSSQWDFRLELSERKRKPSAAAGVVAHAKRKVTSATITKIIPPVMLTILILSVHFLPPESGEKVSVAITVFLANIVFLSETEKILGNKSREASMYLIYLLILTFVSGVSTVVSVAISKLYAHPRGTNIESSPEITQQSSYSKNKIGIIECANEQTVKTKSNNYFKKCFLSHQKLDKIFFLLIIIFLLLYIIIALSASSEK
ncbi:acetylcholine receptor subunit gamma-like [Octopus sinensis]|uniref:Acetylcholine receptor subunit gamma-like n=1 Tax=Octopus sinensis TaxID=2607531 RepID=A0A6P7T6S3_9MOLL|nr:acetylcholine receptor subunit gamma-like [Octopus sinensis]